MTQPLIITQGDPTGVGPEIICKAWLAGCFDALSRPLLVAGDLAVMQRAAALFGAGFSVGPGQGLATHILRLGERQLGLAALSHLDAARLGYGAPDVACGRAMRDYIQWACDRCLEGTASGMVTAPINKAAIAAAGCDFPGHTELLAARCGAPRVVMMLAGARLRVALVTTHLPLRAVPEALSQESILHTLRITHADLRRYFALPQPRLAVLALNPHAGEEGLFGDEEQRLITPAIAAARREGIHADGPHSADTLFHFAVQGSHDAVICMYHDQGLIPLKLLHFEDAVNLTLGLPIVRTSVDHGTAYDIAGRGRASHASLAAAVRLAAEMAEAAP
ncbi:4-hydroxythreonine-4-phosphate dehydrogenase PdxA [Geoalkalibacter halelectricus]|uniref:4-hydroxythreonine-4-phosphate dehydrogenase n=1 Tax=Geoalkalibacter halelectricus TaxID=2847045 RepID=A0ABY5ZNK9_9BACT|nr:4-hydroxythreonine-4-phosphate dehydrogenase PdxA [Geoalkalibacter halelectricus]MDO3378452.1 4-hydroxythreonine-4-phosphate dehydrogenase PdxA [Geoalkalibacter halelectricus]UWZ80228.1 4-hydroxythreonine-4-phosphate dehydrogenase PdxA [Geoalkalibacter halelectricus]